MRAAVRRTALAALLACISLPVPAPAQSSAAEWPAYGGGPLNLRYSALDQIDRSNVGRLRVAWTYRTGAPGEMQCQPIVVEAVLYCTTAELRAFALRADTGEEIWSFEPAATRPDDRRHVNRGVVYWSDGDDRRILYSAGPRLYALDAETGKPVASFGENGSVDLRAGLGVDAGRTWVIATTPGVIYRDLLIQGTRVSEAEGAAPGHVRAFDVRTGAIRWTFHTIPRPGEPGAESWPAGSWRTAGGANSWAGMSLDPETGVVYVPTGSATPDFYGGHRQGENLFANTLLALDAATGRRIWHFQTVHHDVWDRDLPAPPNLVTVEHAGSRIPAVAQITKSGFVYLFDRRSGSPLFPVDERPAPASDLVGERTWPTQPVPRYPEPFARQRFTPEEATNLSPAARAAVLERLWTLRADHPLNPPSVQGTVILPGFDGGGEWGGAAFDPESGLLYVNASEMPWIAAMVPRAPQPSASAPANAAAPASGAQVFAANCAGCHGADLRGSGDRGPSLVGVGERRSAAEIRRIIEQGAGFMPPFGFLPEAEKTAVVAYLRGEPASPAAPVPAAAASAANPEEAPRAPYRFRGYERFLDPDGYPAIRPPWGTLNAIDLNRGEIRWKVPLGEVPELSARGIPVTGTENYGGPVVTKGGLVFIAATRDARIRAFDSSTGEVLWQAQLPAGGYATPAVYSVGGKQFVVVAAGGVKMGTPAGDSYVAFALPE